MNFQGSIVGSKSEYMSRNQFFEYMSYIDLSTEYMFIILI